MKLTLTFGFNKHHYSNTPPVQNVYHSKPDGRGYIMYLAKYVRCHGFDGWHWYACTSLGSYAVWYNKLHNTVYLMAVAVTPRGPHCCQYSIQVASGRIEPRRPISRILDTHPYTRYISLSSEYRSSIPVTEKYRGENSNNKMRYWLPWFLGKFSVAFGTMTFCNLS